MLQTKFAECIQLSKSGDQKYSHWWERQVKPLSTDLDRARNDAYQAIRTVLTSIWSTTGTDIQSNMKERALFRAASGSWVMQAKVTTSMVEWVYDKELHDHVITGPPDETPEEALSNLFAEENISFCYKRQCIQKEKTLFM